MLRRWQKKTSGKSPGPGKHCRQPAQQPRQVAQALFTARHRLWAGREWRRDLIRQLYELLISSVPSQIPRLWKGGGSAGQAKDLADLWNPYRDEGTCRSPAQRAGTLWCLPSISELLRMGCKGRGCSHLMPMFGDGACCPTTWWRQDWATGQQHYCICAERRASGGRVRRSCACADVPLARWGSVDSGSADFLPKCQRLRRCQAVAAKKAGWR